jgi:hypothetical protein
MSSHDLTLIGYAAVVVSGLIIELVARRRGSKVWTLDSVVRWALHTRSGHVGLFTFWAWLGLHFFG